MLVSQIIKMLSNIETTVEKQTDGMTTGNKAIKLKKWEQDFLEIG